MFQRKFLSPLPVTILGPILDFFLDLRQESLYVLPIYDFLTANTGRKNTGKFTSTMRKCTQVCHLLARELFSPLLYYLPVCRDNNAILQGIQGKCANRKFAGKVSEL